MKLSHLAQVFVGREFGWVLLLTSFGCQSTQQSSVSPATDSPAGVERNAAPGAAQGDPTGTRSTAAAAASSSDVELHAQPGAASVAGEPELRFNKLTVEKIFGDNAAQPCESSADCAITCATDGQCCPELCGCSQPINRRSLEKLTAHLQQACVPKPICPLAQCAGLKRYEARCEQGLCTARKVPE